MKYYRSQNVFDAALDRIRWLFDEFPNVVVNFSGGKDSTVVLNLSLIVAEEKGRLPLRVMFIDQEAEWQTVVDYVRTIMTDPRVHPLWLQVPIKIFNATSAAVPWLQCWEEGAEWIRPKESFSLKQNVYGTDRFVPMFEAFLAHEFPHERACYLAGVRTEESPGRFLGLTTDACYHDITWGKTLSRAREHFNFYPIYDWTYKDVWKAIHDNHWPYCALYDAMYQHGYPVMQMRVSNVHHETAVMHLFHLQEIEGETYNRITQRIAGVQTANHLSDEFFGPSELPFMFTDWREYRDYLLEHLITDPETRSLFATQFQHMDQIYARGGYLTENVDVVYRAHVATLLTNDYHFTKLKNFTLAQRKRVPHDN